MASSDLTTEEGMLAYLQQNGYSTCHDVQRLLESNSAFVFRAHLSDPNGPQSIVAKHYEPFASFSRSVPMDGDRMQWEKRGLTLLSGPNIPASPRVRPPRLLGSDDAQRVLLLEDVGRLPSVKGWLRPGSTRDVSVARRIGAALGRYLAGVHGATAGRTDLLAPFEGNVPARALSGRLFFGNLVRAAARFGFEDEVIARAAERGQKEVLEASDVFTLGDFWTGNVLVSTEGDGEDGGNDDDDDDDDARLQLYPLDFEFSKPGTASFDIGQMAAEMYFLAAFRDREPGMALLESFLDAYRRASQAPVDAARVAIRVGAHFLTIAPRAWADEAGEDKLQEIASLARELIRMGWDKDEVALKRSIVGKLMM